MKMSEINFNALIKSLMQVESSCNPLAIGDNKRAVGCLQIHEILIKDVNKLCKRSYNWPEDCFDENRSFGICRLYLENYGRVFEKKNGYISYEVLARMWNGGPEGYKKQATEPYWNKVKSELQKLAIKFDK